MKVGLALSGGGAKGGYQAGAIAYIYRNIVPRWPEMRPRVLRGVSVGALHAALLAQDDGSNQRVDEMIDVWQNVKDEDVYSGWDVLSVIAKAIKESSIEEKTIFMRSLMDNSPLYQNVIKKHIFMPPAGVDVGVGVTSLTTGKYRLIRPSDCAVEEMWRYSVFASTIMPLIWDAQRELIYTDGSRERNLVDGGLRHVSPTGELVDADCTHAFVVNCSSPNEGGTGNMNIDNIMDAALASVDIFVNGNLHRDVKEFRKINKLVKQAADGGVILRKDDGTPYVVCKDVIVNPIAPLNDSLDFTHARYFISAGHDAAAQAFEDFVP